VSKPIVVKIFRNGGVVDIKQFVHEQQIIIGSSDADTHIKLEGQVSPFHASIERRGDKYTLSDLGTPQGTYLKGSKVLESNLDHGDKIAIGEYILEFYIGAPVVGASSSETATAAPTASTTPTPSASIPAPVEEATMKAPQVSVRPVTSTVTVGTVGGMATHVAPVATSMSKSKKGEKTFAPTSHYKDLGEFIRPTKGSTVEVLVSWKERVISSYHFHSKGTFYYGSHPSCDIVVPSLTTKVSRAPLIQIDGQASIFVPPGMAGSLVVDNQSVPLTQLYAQGRLQSTGGGASKITLSQGEMVRVHLGAEVELVIRYCSETPKPLFIPMVDFTSNGFLAVLLAVIMAIVVSLYVALNKLDATQEEDEEYRTALIIENPPPPPPPVPITKVEPPKVEEKKVEEPPKKVKVIEQKPAEKPKVVEKKVETPKVNKAPVKQQPVKKAGGGNGAPAQSMKANPNKPKSNQVGSVKQGGSVKTAPKDGAQAESQTKDPTKSGIFGVFGAGGKQKTLDNTYSGGGQLAGLADQSTGQSGFGEDRAGEGLGSKFKETGGGNGKSNVGVSGISSGKGLGTGSGFGGVGLGGKGSVTILPGGDGESYGGNIDRNGIRQVFMNNQRAIQTCYEKALSGDKGLSGKLVLDFDIGEQGRVLRADYSRAKSTLANDELATCIINRMKGWRFPEPPTNQTVNVFYPLAFSSK
jgi:hypothetical protein